MKEGGNQAGYTQKEVEPDNKERENNI